MGAIRVLVTHVKVVAAARGHGEGINEEGSVRYFVGDFRPMLHIADALKADAEVAVCLEEYQIQRLFKLTEGIDVRSRTERETKAEGESHAS
jgi:hypothetical protein